VLITTQESRACENGNSARERGISYFRWCAWQGNLQHAFLHHCALPAHFLCAAFFVVFRHCCCVSGAAPIGVRASTLCDRCLFWVVGWVLLFSTVPYSLCSHTACSAFAVLVLCAVCCVGVS
jgi:hypothetical protein